MKILKTIIPILAIIGLGLLARRGGWITTDFLGPANRLVYHLAIPAMMFRAIAGSELDRDFDLRLLIGTALPPVLVYGLVWGLVGLAGLERRQRGTFVESAVHGNIGYIGLAVVVYYLGQGALATAGILAGVLMLIQNILAVIVLQVYAQDKVGGNGLRAVARKIIGNPIILTAAIGILFSGLGFSQPVIADRSLAIIGNLALPLALLIIGASLSFRIDSRQLKTVGLACLFKLLVLPGFGWAAYHAFGLPPAVFLPGLILLMSPVATVVFILATELQGDTRLAVDVISVSTVLSALTMTLWLSLA